MVRSKKCDQDINNKINNIKNSPLLKIPLAIIATNTANSQPNQVKSYGVLIIFRDKNIDLNQLLKHLRISIVNLIAIIESCVLATSIFRS